MLNATKSLFALIFLLAICNVECQNEDQIDFRIREQSERHRTSEFYQESNETNDVIFRRGQEFFFNVLTDSDNQIEVKLKYVSKKNTLVVDLPTYGWRIRQKPESESVYVAIHVPGHAPVGVWNMNVVVKNSSGLVVNSFVPQQRLIILFNPWSREDSVFMPDNNQLNEYVLNERGIIYTSYGYGPDWLYNQFKPGVLSAVLYVLDKSTLTAAERGDPVKVSRQLTWLVNYVGGPKGVLVGRWREPYDSFERRPATHPSAWTGSAPILLEYHQSGGRPVAYGQCWVFGGVLTTMLRALGIPARPVTTLNSGKDESYRLYGDLIIDQYIDEKGYLIKQKSDSIWNFHVWVNAWFSRVDLGHRYSGWQEVDGTPQGEHDGYYQVGPASQRALRNADLMTKYESYFVYSEANADVVTYNHRNEIVDISTNGVGTALLTKGVGSNRFVDITWLYKPREGSREERAQFQKAARSLGLNPVSLRRVVSRNNRNAVTVQILNQNTTIGSTIQVVLKLTNPTLESKLVQLGLKLTSLYYFGKDGQVIKQLLEKVNVPAKKTKMISFEVTPNEYINKLLDFNNVRIEAVVYGEKGQMERSQQNIALLTPPLKITCTPRIGVRKTFNLRVEFTNPLQQVLRNGYYIIEGTRIDRLIKRVTNIAAGARKVIDIPLTSNVRNSEDIVVSFKADDILELRGSAKTQVI